VSNASLSKKRSTTNQKDSSMSARRMCSRKVDVAHREETIQAAAQRMLARNVGALVVVNPAGNVLGILTDRDLTCRVLAQGLDPYVTLVEDVMTRAPHTISEETPIDRAMALMRSGGYRRLPVLDGSGKLCGILSLDDVIRVLSQELHDAADLIRQEGPESLAKAAEPVGYVP
jgi:CBS domain-containing protein